MIPPSGVQDAGHQAPDASRRALKRARKWPRLPGGKRSWFAAAGVLVTVWAFERMLLEPASADAMADALRAMWLGLGALILGHTARDTGGGFGAAGGESDLEGER